VPLKKWMQQWAEDTTGKSHVVCNCASEMHSTDTRILQSSQKEKVV